MNIYKINNIGELIRDNTYVGRGIVIGKSKDGKKAAIAYFIMGRSENSRNRIFREEGDSVTIYPFDESKVEDPSLIIYSPIRVCDNHTIVTNGDQTDTIYDFLAQGARFSEALEVREFEPDCPNFTPRISGMVTIEEGEFTYEMSILKSSTPDGAGCNRFTFSYEPDDGLGHFIHTYMGDGDPLPSFEGEPKKIEIMDDIDGFTDMLWESLNEDNKVSLFVRYIDIASGETEDRIVNKNK